MLIIVSQNLRNFIQFIQEKMSLLKLISFIIGWSYANLHTLSKQNHSAEQAQ